MNHENGGAGHIIKTKKYCIFSTLFLPNLGGIERFTLNLGKKLKEYGNDVVIVTSNVFGQESVRVEHGMKIYRLPCFNVLNGRFPILKFNKEFKQLYKKIKEEHPDYVIVNAKFYIHSLLGVKYAAKHHLPVIEIEHGTNHFTVNNFFFDMLGHIYEHFITQCVKKYCKNFYGVSLKCNDWLRHFGISAKGVIYNSVDSSEMLTLLHSPVVDYRKKYGISPEAVVITFTGRLLKEKGIMKLIEAYNGIDNDGVYLMIAGDGDLDGEVEKKAGAGIIYLGKIDFPHIAALLAETDIFCLPTDYPEGFPTSLLEAAISKCYIITTDCGGAKELLPTDEYGTVLEQNTVEALRDSIICAIKNKSEREKAIELIHEHLIKNFTWDATAKKVADIFNRG